MLYTMRQNQNKTEQSQENSTSTSQSSPEVTGSQTIPSEQLSPVVSPLPFTGASLDLEFTDTELAEINEERELRHSAPYDGINFMIEYNDYEDRFFVLLYEPKSQTQEQFQQWKDLTFPNIKQERFIFQ